MTVSKSFLNHISLPMLLIVALATERSYGADEFLSKLCGSKEKETIKRTVKVIPPKPPAGIPLDKANKCVGIFKAALRPFLQNFFFYLTLETTRDYADSNRPLKNTVRIEVENARFISDEFQKKLTDIRIINEPDSFTYEGDGNCPMKPLPSQWEVTELKKRGFVYPNAGYESVFNTYKLIKGKDQNKYMLIYNDDDDDKRLVIPSETLWHLREKYVLVFPKAIAKTYTIDSTEASERWGGGGNVNEDVDRYTLHWFLGADTQFWEQYLRRSTSIKQLDKSGNEFELTLNLSGACKHLRKRSDLTSK